MEIRTIRVITFLLRNSSFLLNYKDQIILHIIAPAIQLSNTPRTRFNRSWTSIDNHVFLDTLRFRVSWFLLNSQGQIILHSMAPAIQLPTTSHTRFNISSPSLCIHISQILEAPKNELLLVSLESIKPLRPLSNPMGFHIWIHRNHNVCNCNRYAIYQTFH